MADRPLGPILAAAAQQPHIMHWSRVKASRLGASMRHSMTLTERMDHLIGELVYDLEAAVLTDKKISTEYETVFTVEVPSSWFQHLKAARMRPWILRRWPVRYTRIEKRATIRCAHDVLYPDANFVPESFGKPVQYSRWEPF